MAEIGYFLSCEEHPAPDLVRFAAAAEQVGFTTAMISDHYHPWIDRQGESPFVWCVIGGIAAATERLRLGTGVTCPTIRIHPAVMAQAAATAATMLPGRFFFGVGSGENLNEHVLGDRWPPAATRLEMLEEAIEVMRLLWQGGSQSHEGKHYRVENARIYSLPDQPPPVMVSAFGPKAMALAGSVGDGYVGTSPAADLLAQFDEEGGAGKPKLALMKVCWGEDEAAARRLAFELWPNTGLPGELAQELPTPAHFEQATSVLEEQDVAGTLPCGPDPDRHAEAIRSYLEVGYDEVYVHQIGPDQDGFFRFYRDEVLSRVGL